MVVLGVGAAFSYERGTPVGVLAGTPILKFEDEGEGGGTRSRS